MMQNEPWLQRIALVLVLVPGVLVRVRLRVPVRVLGPVTALKDVPVRLPARGIV